MDEQDENEQPVIVPLPDAENAAPEPSLSRVPRGSSGNRLQTIITLSVLVIVVLVILATLTPLKNIVTQQANNPSPTPVPTIAPGDDLFYISTAPAWGSVTVDGHTLAHIPSYPAQPMRLSRGKHIIAWHADPFFPMSCIVYVPSLPQEPCPNENPFRLTAGGQPTAREVEFDATLQNLPNNLSSALVSQTQAALDALQSSTTVQPGELYARLPSPQIAAADATRATQPLHAVLRFHLDTRPNSNRSYAGPGQQCRQFCSYSFNQPSLNPGQHIWLAQGLYYPTWDYSTLNGQVVAQGQPDSTTIDGTTSDYATFFDIQWINQTWHVTVDSSILQKLTQNNQSQDPACKSIQDQTRLILSSCATLQSDNPACRSLGDLVSNDLMYSQAGGTTTTIVNWSYIVSKNPADGCLGIIVPQAANPSAPVSRSALGYCLYRFGVLLAANDVASHYWYLPMADAYEQQIAQQDAASIGL